MWIPVRKWSKKGTKKGIRGHDVAEFGLENICKICVIHAKDFVVDDGVFKTVKLSEGLLNYKLIFEKMKEYNLDIPIICEEITDSDAVVAFRKLEKIRKNL